MLCHAVQICRDVVKNDGYIAASIGCYGGALADGSEYTGNYGNVTLSDLIQFHRQKLDTLITCNPDFIAFETVPNTLEIRAILSLLPIDISCWLSLACNDSLCLNDGTSLSDALHCIDEMDPNQSRLNAIGLNCFSCRNCKLLMYIHCIY